jgi:6-pyruvoyl-tetrahydropterin synthase
MVVDFSDIKSIAKGFIDSERDHGYMFQQGDIIGDLIVTTGLK